MELKYRKMEQHQHYLHRPETYIGSVSPEQKTDYIVNDEGNVVKQDITSIPAIERLFVEAMSNAIDNFSRSADRGVPCTSIKVTVDEVSGLTSVWNDGMWIPVTKNEDGSWIPEFIFGQLLTSSNYDDEEERYTSGRNGIGVKAVNIFSSSFVLECADEERGLVYKQQWSNNMMTCKKPTVKCKSGVKGYTKVSWIPDFEYFKTDGYDADTIGILRRHVYETAMITGLKVFWNNSRVSIHRFSDYPKRFHTADTPAREVLVIELEPKITMALIPSQSGFDQISFVNGIHTTEGGTHVDACLDAILKPLLQAIRTKRGVPASLSMRDLKAQFVLFVNCWVPNPKFSGQTKGRLTHPRLSFSVDEKAWKPLLRWSFLERIKEQAETTALVKLQKSERTRGYTVIPGYERANKEGTKNASKCSLILCEGLSARTYAITGMERGVDFGGDVGKLKGKDWFGALALRGKCFARGTRVRMANGKTCCVEDIKDGDRVVSDKLEAVNVQGTIRGTDQLFTVTQSSGVTYEVTSDHILVLRAMHKPSISWDDERCRWIVTVFDPEKMELVEKHIECLIKPDQKYLLTGRKPVTREDGFRMATEYIREKKINKNIHIYVHDYMRLDSRIRNILFGVRIYTTPSKSVKHVFSKLTITKSKIDEFYGFRIGGNHHFLLEDGTVVHNCLNVRNASKDSIANNKEITNIIQVLGLKYGVDYSKDENYRTLRYGRVILMADSDLDGLHIGGLILNIFHHLFPSLMNRHDFFYSMLTPVMKIIYKKQVHRFYTIAEAHQFIQRNHSSKMEIKYYKGLGTSTDADIKETFGKRVVQFVDTSSATPSMLLAFDKKMVLDRKEWLRTYNAPPPLAKISETVFGRTLTDFLQKELVMFSRSDCLRNLPNLYDGLKESQRKVLYACFLRNMTQDTSVKVAQLSGYVAEKTDYHHGEQCLQDTIIRMAQDYVGSNNIPLLLKDGQVGTRISSGHDAASPRYVFVRMCAQTRILYPSVDDDILQRVEEDGIKVEPRHYVPILPMLLVNGSEGIGTGWSCSVPAFNPVDLRKWVECWLRHKPTPELIPWYNGFLGTITKQDTHRYITQGIVEQTKPHHYTVSEIPVGMSIDKFKETCDSLMINKKIKSFRNNSTSEAIHFDIVAHPDFKCTVKTLGLSSTLSTSNMVVLGEDNQITKYNTLDELMTVYCKKRIEQYTNQKTFMVNRLTEDRSRLFAKLRFMKKVMSGDIVIFKRPENEILDILLQKRFPKVDGTYSYLLDIPVRQFTEQKLDLLKRKLDDADTALAFWAKTTEADLWRADLTSIQ